MESLRQEFVGSTRWLAALAAGLLGLACQPADTGRPAEEAPPAEEAAPPTFASLSDSDLKGAVDEASEWRMYGKDYTNRRWSPLDQINRQNVSGLVPVWVYQTGAGRLGSFENTPLVFGGVMYLTTPWDNVMAVDARTGEELWRYEGENELGETTIFCCGPNNRGVAAAYGKLYLGTLDARLVALDQRTGEKVWETQIADPAAGYSETMAPTVYEGKVLIGTAGAEYGIRGFLKAFDAETGALVWTWHTIPSPEEGGWWGEWAETTPGGENLNRDIAQEKADSAKHADSWKVGGGSIWQTPAIDDETGTVFVSIGNPSPDLDGSIRPGDNRWTESICAINIADGTMKWCHQYLPHDVWDLDAASPAALVRLSDGTKAVIHAGKTGWTYVLDAETGERIRRSQNWVPHENLFAQPTAEGVRMLPGANGGAEWSPTAFNPQLGYQFIAALHQPMNYITHFSPYEKGKLWLGSAFVAVPGEDQGGYVVAVDVNTGDVAWSHETEDPMMGGLLATAGGLVFTGEGNGDFEAFDAETGDILWKFNCGAGANAAPMTYELDGRQYVTVACGGNFQLGYRRGDAVFTFALAR
ncbi:MAG: pyrroloquinoline quinone-dependent dehydrogenase [Gemmatimonadota bacterium]